MDTQKCHVLLRAIELGSFSAAANELNCTPSGVRQMVESVENEIGFSLLHRSKSGVMPTDACKSLIPRLYELIRAEQLLRQDADDLRGLSRGTLDIGAYSSVATHLLPSVIKQFHHVYPHIDIRLREGIYVELENWLENNELDFCIYSGNPLKNYDWFPLYKDPMLAVLPPDHPMAKAASFPIQKFNGEPFIMPGNRGGGYDVVTLLEKYHIKPDIKFSTIENYSVLSMVACGLGSSIMNEGVTIGILSDAVKIPLDPPQYITIGIQIPSFKNGSPSAKKMISYLRKTLTTNL